MTKRECLLVLIFAITFFLFTGNDGVVIAQDTEQFVDVCDAGTAVRLKSVTAKFNDFKQEIGAITTTPESTNSCQIPPQTTAPSQLLSSVIKALWVPAQSPVAEDVVCPSVHK